MTDPPRPEMDHIHTWFGLTYSNYLVLPRAVLQSAPDEWQERFVQMLGELNDMYGHLDWPDSYRVMATGSGGRFVKDPIPHYRRGRTYIPPRLPEDPTVTVTWPDRQEHMDDAALDANNELRKDNQ